MGEGYRAEAPDPRVDDRILELLAERPGVLAFNGLRRALGIHPESLVRALRRLERAGALHRTDAGYGLREPAPARGGPPPKRSRTIASVRIPRDVGPEEMLGRLAGRWFSGLRWVGVYDNPDGPLLAWSIVGSDHHVLLGVWGGALRVRTDGPAEEPAVARAAFELLEHAMQGLRQGPLGGPTGPLTFARESPEPPGFAS